MHLTSSGRQPYDLTARVEPVAVGGYRRFMADEPGSARAWEYLTAPLLIHNTKAILDGFGGDGWELVTVLPGPNPDGLVAYFKRPVSNR